MSNNAEIVFAGNAKQLLDEYKKLEKANEQLSQKLLAAMKVSKQAANEEKKLRQEVTAAIEKSKTPAEAYIATINRYKQALQSGMITAEQFNRVRDKELQKLNATKAATDKLTDAEKKNLATKKLAVSVANETDKTNSLLTSGFTLVTAAVSAATLGLKAFADEQQRIQDRSSGTTVAIDKMAREYAVQAGLSEDQVNPARDRILAIAKDNSIAPDKAFAAVKQLSSVGHKEPLAVLDSFLKITATSNLKEGDQAQLASSMAMFLGSYDLPINEENFTALGVRMRGLMDGLVEVSELADFAKAMPVFANARVPMGEALGLMAGLRNKMSAAEVATGTSSVMSILRGASGDASNTKALKEIGLTPEDVDVVGETATEALTRVKTALDKAPEEKRAGILTQLFGRENESKASLLMGGVSEVPKYIEMQNNTKGFVEGVERAGQGPAAEQRRGEINQIQADLEFAGIASTRDMINRHFEAERMRDYAAIENDPNKWEATKKAQTWGLWAVGGMARGISSVFVNPEDKISPETLMEIKQKYATGKEFTEADLRARMGNMAPGAAAPPAANNSAPIVDAINRQTGVLNVISNKLTPPAKPTENPNLQGRPKQ